MTRSPTTMLSDWSLKRHTFEDEPESKPLPCGEFKSLTGADNFTYGPYPVIDSYSQLLVAIENDNVDTLKYRHEMGYKHDKGVLVHAICNDAKECVKYLIFIGVELNETAQAALLLKLAR